MKLKRLAILIISAAFLAAVSSVSAKAAKVEDYRYLVFTADISETGSYGQLELFFVPGDLTAPAFVRSRLNVRGVDDSPKDFDSGFRQVKLVHRPLVQIKSNYGSAATTMRLFAALSGKRSANPLDDPSVRESYQPSDSIVFQAYDKKPLESGPFVRGEEAYAALQAAMLLNFTMSAKDFDHPTYSFRSELLVQLSDLDNSDLGDSETSKSKRRATTFYGSSVLTGMTDNETATLSSLLTLSSCAGSFGAGVKTPRRN